MVFWTLIYTKNRKTLIAHPTYYYIALNEVYKITLCHIVVPVHAFVHPYKKPIWILLRNLKIKKRTQWQRFITICTQYFCVGFLKEFLPTSTSYWWYTGIPHPFLAEDTLTAIAFNIRMTLNSTAKIFLRTKIFTVVVSVSKRRIGNSFLTLPLWCTWKISL